MTAENDKPLLALIERGVAASADALAEVSGVTWQTQTASITAGGVESVRGKFQVTKPQYYGAYLSMPGAVFVLMLPKDEGLPLAKAFLGDRGIRPGTPVPKESECVAEIANIVVHAVANHIADACDKAFLLSAPQMVTGLKADLLEVALDKLAMVGEAYAVMTYVHMSSKSLSSDCTLLMFLTPSFRGGLLKSLS